MNIPSLPLSRVLSTATIALFCLLAFPIDAYAKGPKGFQHGSGKESKNKNYKQNDRDGDDRRVYASHPRSGFALTYGNGYAGQGYYYGPPRSRYYYQRSDVRYYASREAAPREYYSNDAYSGGGMDSAVQRELARRGYYQGYVDGQIGPKSQRAIASYQQDRGLRPTGIIDSSLLESMGIR